MPQSKFTPQQAVELADAFARHRVDYLFIGKSGAILLGYPAVTQDVDLFLPKDKANAQRVLKALAALGFEISALVRRKILRGADFIQLKNGPFDLDLIHAPDGIESFPAAKSRSVVHDGFPVANLRDIIASKRASGRQRDLLDLPLLDVSYEQLVENPELQTRRLLEFVGVDWDARCLSFHENNRFVGTASNIQIRKPMYRSSIGRWKNYEKHLDPLQAALARSTETRFH